MVAVMVIDARGLGWLGWCRGTNTLGSNAEPMRAVEGLYIAGPAMPAVTPLADRPSYSTLAWRCGSRFRWAIRTPEGFGELIRLAIVKGFADLVGCLAPVRSVRGIVPFESLRVRLQQERRFSPWRQHLREQGRPTLRSMFPTSGPETHQTM